MTHKKDGEWRSNLKTTHIAKEPEHKEKTKVHTQETEGAEIKLRYYEQVADSCI